MVRVVAGVVALAAVLALTVTPGRAALYEPDDPLMSLPVGPDGRGQALPFREFKRRLLDLLNDLNPQLKTPARELLTQRIAARKRTPNPAAEETAALAADLLRTGNPDEALNRLAPRVRDRQPNYFVLTTLAEAHAMRGEWAEAFNVQYSALEDVGMPEAVKGLTREQVAWQAKLDRDYVLYYYRIHKAESAARPRPAPEDEDVLPLFPPPERGKPHAPVRFVDAQGKYTPGDLAPAERAKLPPDAIAVVQQLILWFPTDPRLYWLLGELYAATGQLDEAERIFNECVSEARKYGNRRVLMEHRGEVRKAADAKRQAEAEAKAREEAGRQAQEEATRRELEHAANTGRYAVWAFGGLLGAVAAFALLRVLFRRGKGANCGPVG